MAKAQAHFRLEPDLLEAIKVKAEAEKITVTDLVTKFLMQGLGLDIQIDTQKIDQIAIEESVYQRVSERVTNQLADTHINPQSVDQSAIEETVYQRVSDCVTTQFSELEESILKRVAIRISDLNDNWEKDISEGIRSQFTELEERILERIATSVSDLNNNWEKRISNCVTKPKEKTHKIQDKERISEEGTTDKDDESEPKRISDSVSLVNTQGLQEIQPKDTRDDSKESERISNSVSSVHTEKLQETQSENKTLTLFNTAPSEQILIPGKMASLLNENTSPKNWSIHKLKNLRLRQLTWIKNYKNPDKKTKGKATLPLIVGKYLIDWVISDDDEKATGKKWWIKELPDNEDEIETLIKEREAKYITYYFEDAV